MAKVIKNKPIDPKLMTIRTKEELSDKNIYWKLDDGNRITSIEEFNEQTLHNIGAHYCTDKTHKNRTAEISYLQIYEMYFQRFKEAPIDMVEIGVRRGQSINTWNKYFTNANSIYGIDIDETWWESLLFDHIHYIHADATEPAILDKFPPEQEFDIIIDDGSHINEQIIKSFEIFYPRLKSGGIYVIEDLYNSYGTRFFAYGDLTDIEVRQILGSSSGINENRRPQLDKWLRTIEKNLNNPTKDIMFIHHWDSIIIIGKV